MNTEEKKQNRRKFISWGVASAALLTAARFLLPAKSKPESKTQMVKMLTEDGKLVEVDIAALNSEKRKITNKELQNWVKK